MFNDQDLKLYGDMKGRLNKAMEHFDSELSSIRAGRANPKLLDKVVVDYYGSMTPLNQMANIAAADARTLTISLWDISALKDVLKAINASGLGLNPSDDGKIIRLVVPAPTEERRLELVKMVKKIAEDTRVQMRNARRDILDQFKTLKKNGEITEGDMATAEKEVQKILDNAINEVNKALENKEKDIMEV